MRIIIFHFLEESNSNNKHLMKNIEFQSVIWGKLVRTFERDIR